VAMASAPSNGRTGASEASMAVTTTATKHRPRKGYMPLWPPPPSLPWSLEDTGWRTCRSERSSTASAYSRPAWRQWRKRRPLHRQTTTLAMMSAPSSAPTGQGAHPRKGDCSEPSRHPVQVGGSAMEAKPIMDVRNRFGATG
jgi:hypothetical protein